MNAKRLFFSIGMVGMFFLTIGTYSAKGAPVQTITVPLGDSGWSASWNVTTANDFSIALKEISVGADRVLFTKVATFGPDRVDQAANAILPIDIVFSQTVRDAKPLVVANGEAVTNKTGVAWNGFTLSVIDGTTGTSGQSFINRTLTGDPSQINTPGFFNAQPFTSATYSPLTSADQILTLTGGIVANGDTWLPGGGGTLGQLVVNALPTRSGAFRTFVLEEQPSSAGVIPIPLPAAAWTGLSGLLGLGLMGCAKKIRSLFV